VPPPPTSPERRLPLRQLPSERSFSASPRNVDPVRNDWVLPHLKTSHKKAHKAQNNLAELVMCLLCLFVANEICHFASDGFCLFESKISLLTTRNQLDAFRSKIFF
jgi:hypothetical protein